MEKKGWIALDIDGTITEDKHAIPVPVCKYLQELSTQGWNIAFATGRSFTFASKPLAALNFPYYFLPQNGSVSLKMPGKTLLEKWYLTLEDLEEADQLCGELGAQPLAFAGFEMEDRFFYRPGRFSAEEQAYLIELKSREGEKWNQVTSFDSCSAAGFPLLKYFGAPAKIARVAKALEKAFQVTHIRDPFAPGIDLLLVTKKDVSKGLSLARLFEKEGRGQRVIAAGDDRNDLSMFEVADFAIAMPHAPAALLEQADLIAPPTAEFGIISALSQALSRTLPE